MKNLPKAMSNRVQVWTLMSDGDEPTQKNAPSLVSIFVYLDPDLASRPKYYRTDTGKYTIEQVLMFFK
jgi:hypothetical protein